jgi:hypothetical protein
MKPINITKNNSETIFDAAKRASNQANLNNRIVNFVCGNYSILVYPFDVIKNIIVELKKIALHQEIEALQAKISQ